MDIWKEWTGEKGNNIMKNQLSIQNDTFSQKTVIPQGEKTKTQAVKKAEETMRILANFLIDRYLEDKKNNRLQSILKPPTINLEQKDNHGN